ncbi:unnamed protein product [Coregonus sp. 'balchen']|nr:unnamed protein product [Coregonus sp. 'balchen']
MCCIDPDPQLIDLLFMARDMETVIWRGAGTGNLPAKSVEEALRHKQEYDEMVAGAKRKELKEAHRKKCQMKERMLKYFAAFDVFFEENLPRLFNYFQINNLTPNLYLIDW